MIYIEDCKQYYNHQVHWTSYRQLENGIMENLIGKLTKRTCNVDHILHKSCTSRTGNFQ